MYRTVFRDVLNFVRALELAESRVAVESAAPLGNDRLAGEVDPPFTARLVDALGEWRSPLDALGDGSADPIKWLKRREAESLDLLLECGPAASKPPLSLMRAETFGRCQSRITQALRRDSGADVLADLIDCTESESYREREATYRAR